jgi:hypothetical protein
MKVALSTLALLALAACGHAHDASQVEASKSFKPNMYSCTTDDNLQVGYSKTSIFGQPSFSVTETFGRRPIQLVEATGESIKVEGEKVSVTQNVPDRSSTTWTLVIPAGTAIASGDVSVFFDTKLVEVVRPTSIAGPLPGQVPTTTEHKARCEGNFAAF